MLGLWPITFASSSSYSIRHLSSAMANQPMAVNNQIKEKDLLIFTIESENMCMQIFRTLSRDI
jgi:hypothetical protein